MKRQIWYFISTVLLALLVLSKGEITLGAGADPWEEEPLQSQQAESSNLLANGSMEENFYWKYPNHFVAKDWNRWWTESSPIPEYDDVRDWRSHRYDGDHAQIYYWLWPQAYTAGIFQQVAVQPCTFYQFDMYGRNSSYPSTDHHARIGIDPLGREYGLYMSPFPDDVVWSPEQTFHNTWGQHIVATEAYSDHITAITYVSPDSGSAPYETFWDAGTLVEMQPPEGRLPSPEYWGGDGFITNVITSTSLDHLVVEWDTPEPASTQAWYSILDTSPTTSTSPYTDSVLYLPSVFNGYSETPALQYATWADQTPVTHHRVLLGPFEDGQMAQFIALSRRMDGGDCRTSVSDLMETKLHIGTVLHLYLPLVVR
ncbi:MAG: hypothetical protein B6I35_11660 [Anaerolineaceae bacterium 4572_32.2]|nr:MAG: hypothetical protein B6I35_11660 [Anaerolineaceae bacterium 4572_32.2]HEY74243.1 hypothetical protein [Thermoflexia bacterium]